MILMFCTNCGLTSWFRLSPRKQPCANCGKAVAVPRADIVTKPGPQLAARRSQPGWKEVAK